MWSKAPVLATIPLILLVACASSQATTTCPEAAVLEAELAAGQEQLVQRANEVVWGPCPPTLPTDCKMAVLEGSPKQEMLFTARFRIDGTLEMKPHRHPQNERVTILEGKVGVGFGDEIDRDNVTWFGPGDYYVNLKGAHHFVLADAPALIQITGIGPWKVNYLDAE